MASGEKKAKDKGVVKQGRRRTESMVQRFSKATIAEGFKLCDKDYLLGAMRLFLFKAETALPFQVVICMDATAEILVQMEEYEDAEEQFLEAAAKYDLLQKPELAKLMNIKAVECSRGPQAALDEVTAFLSEQGAKLSSDGKLPALARIRTYQAELMLKIAAESDKADLAAKAVDVARLACLPEWDRVHSAHVVLGNALVAAGRLEDARKEYAAAANANPDSIVALERHMDVLKLLLKDTTDEARIQTLRAEFLQLLDRAILLHPRPVLLREKAFLLSETQGDATALAYLDPLIRNPPPEEADAVGGVTGMTLATLLKAKAAILADGGRMSEALSAAEAALSACPDDEEAKAIIGEIRQSL